jgi:amino acid permease
LGRGGRKIRNSKPSSAIYQVTGQHVIHKTLTQTKKQRNIKTYSYKNLFWQVGVFFFVVVVVLVFLFFIKKETLTEARVIWEEGTSIEKMSPIRLAYRSLLGFLAKIKCRLAYR